MLEEKYDFGIFPHHHNLFTTYLISQTFNKHASIGKKCNTYTWAAIYEIC